jgi:hypothetical protein
MKQVLNGEKGEHWRIIDGLITTHGKVFVPMESPVLLGLLAHAHGCGHEGTEKTLHRLRADFHVPGACALVRDFVLTCTTCQRNKIDQLQPVGLLQSLPVSSSVWADIRIYFIKGLPKVYSRSVILTIVDRFSKSTHFLSLGHSYSATTLACVFFDNIFKLHSVPNSIVSDHDPVFIGRFWQELFKLIDVNLQFSLAFHLQFDGQSEVMNKIITMYLRCLAGDQPREWLRWLPWAEYCYNTLFQSSIRTSLFRDVYGCDPPTVRSYSPGEARLPAVDAQLRDRDEFLAEVWEQLEQAQQQHKAFYDRKHRQLDFVVGEGAWLRLLHRPIASLDVKGRGKLGPKFFGPFQVTEKISDVAYRLQLLTGARLHDVFHVGLLKKFHGEAPNVPGALPPIRHGWACPTSAIVLRR